MMSFKRALFFAALFITALYFLRQSQTSNDPEPFKQPPKKPESANADKANQGNAKDTVRPPAAESADSAAVGGALKQDSHPAPAQKTLKDLSKMSLYDKLAYQYPYDLESRFPAYIWQTWKNSPASADFAFRDQEASWTELHPGFVHEVITDHFAVSLLKLLYASVPEVLEAYDAMPKPVLKADFFRYLILFARGGIYSDIDTFALKSALDWIPDSVPRSSIGLIVGIEADPDRPDWADWYSRRIQFCQWTIQAKAGHPVLRDIITRITTETLRRKKEGVFLSKDQSIVEFTGPAIWTDTIFDYFNDARYFETEKNDANITYQHFTGMESSKKIGDVVVLPITSFSPGVRQMGAKEVDDPMAFVRHDFEGTWKPESERHIGSNA